MACAESSIPAICISPALFEPPQADSESLFSLSPPGSASEEELYRASDLAPSPRSSTFPRQLSPLRPADAPVNGKGLERERFEALLKASRERNAAVGRKKAVDLRKEIAIKAHKTKQVERRALFLSKVHAPPSPTATLLAKTPPESPAIFHYSFPSPGYLVSPLAAFDTDDSSLSRYREPWVEQVDFRLPEPLQSRQVRNASTMRAANDLLYAKPLPSLDQITARLSCYGQVPAKLEVDGPLRSARQFPAFLQSLSYQDSIQRNYVTSMAPEPVARPSFAITVGRLRMPVRTSVKSKEATCEAPCILPPSPTSSPLTPELQITTTVVPRTSSVFPSELSERNVNQMESRARRSRDMLSTLRRRTSVPHSVHSLLHDQEGQDDERLKRRISAPAELQMRERSGFEHPVLALPGGF